VIAAASFCSAKDIADSTAMLFIVKGLEGGQDGHALQIGGIIWIPDSILSMIYPRLPLKATAFLQRKYLIRLDSYISVP
jgi:hypothetical protein